MKEIIVRIPDENSELATQLLEKLGAEIEERKTTEKKIGTQKSEGAKKVTVKSKKTLQKISPTYLFGKWKNLDIDAKKLREEAWERSHKYL
jgi:hypothetical protein